MYEYASSLVRGGLNAFGDFLGAVQNRIMGWIQGDDLTVIVTLAVVALVALFILVPNRRRY